MKALGRYDGSVQMFVEEPREVDVSRLRFMRWLVEQGKLEHTPAGPPWGEFATAPPIGIHEVTLEGTPILALS
jgi:hypothetical protein